MSRRATPWWVGLGVAAALAFCLFPFAWQILTSFRPEGVPALPGAPEGASLGAYAAVLSRPDFLRAVLNSFAVAALTTALNLALGAPGAFALAKLPVPGRGLVLAAALAVSMLPPVSTVGPLFLALKAIGLRDSALGLVLPYTTFSLPLTLWILTAFFRELPDELLQAARVDGCGPLQALRHVFLPLAAPGLATTGLLVFIFSWNELLYALTFTSSPDQRTIPVAIALFAAGYREPYAEIAAATVLVTLPLIALTLAFQRRIIAGLTAGALKG